MRSLCCHRRVTNEAPFQSTVVSVYFDFGHTTWNLAGLGQNGRWALPPCCAAALRFWTTLPGNRALLLHISRYRLDIKHDVLPVCYACGSGHVTGCCCLDPVVHVHAGSVSGAIYVQSMGDKFELEERIVHAVVSKMMFNEEISGPCVCFNAPHGQEGTCVPVASFPCRRRRFNSFGGTAKWKVALFCSFEPALTKHNMTTDCWYGCGIRIVPLFLSPEEKVGSLKQQRRKQIWCTTGGWALTAHNPRWRRPNLPTADIYHVESRGNGIPTNSTKRGHGNH